MRSPLFTVPLQPADSANSAQPRCMCVYLCACVRTCTCTVCEPISVLLQTDYLFILLKRKKGQAALRKKKITWVNVCVCVCTPTHACVRLRVFILLGLWCQRCLATGWLMSECFPAIYPRACTLGTHTHREQREGKKVRMDEKQRKVRNKGDEVKKIKDGRTYLEI